MSNADKAITTTVKQAMRRACKGCRGDCDSAKCKRRIMREVLRGEQNEHG